MAKWNESRKVLDHQHSHFWRHELREVEQPNLQKDVFPYDEVCRTDFDHKIIPICPADEFVITDTTFRDGQQARPPYSAKQIVDICCHVDRLGGPQRRHPPVGVLPVRAKDKEAVAKCRELGLQFPEITGWIPAARERYQARKGGGLKETGILTSSPTTTYS